MGLPSGQTLSVILNPSAGRPGGPLEARVRQALAAEGVRSEIRVVPPPEIPGAVREASRAHGVVAVAGGDGTLSGAAAALVDTGGVLAPVPVGTHNHFARRLGIDSPETAARAIAGGRVVRVPLGWVDGRPFINHASAGIYPRLVRCRERMRRWTGKTVGNLLAGIYVVIRMERITLGLRLDAARHERTVPGLWIGLGSATFRLPLDGQAPSGRSLDVVVPGTRTRVGFLVRGARALWHMRRGEPLARAGLEVLHTHELTLEALYPIDLSRDGEVERAEPPLHFRIQPDALRVFSLVEDGRSEQALR